MCSDNDCATISGNTLKEAVETWNRRPALSTAPAASEGAAVPMAWHRDTSFDFHFCIGPDSPDNNTSDPNEWKPLFASPPVPKEDRRREVEAFAEKAIRAIKEIANPDLGNKFVLVGPGGILAMACNAVRAALQSEGGK